MSTFTNQTSRAAIEARISERRRAENGDELTTQGDYPGPSARLKPEQKLQSGSVRFKFVVRTKSRAHELARLFLAVVVTTRGFVQDT